MADGVRIGIDVGGTFTDVVAWDSAGQMASCKVPTTPANPAEGVLNGIAALESKMAPVVSIAHGTTMVTNAIVERRGAPVGFITTRGFRDVFEIGRMSRTHLYRMDLPAKPAPLVPRRLSREIAERVTPDGMVSGKLSLEDLPAIIADFKLEGIESVAVCLLHAYANPAHEQELREALKAHFPYVSVSSDINAEFREFERSCTTVLNASVKPLADRYLDDLARRVGGKPLHLVHAAGGMMSVDAAKAFPLSLAMSGPAGGVAAASHTARSLGLARALAFDMGGTTTDVCLIADGVPETAAQRKLGEYPARLPMVAVESIGAGGGSIARVESSGRLRVGPISAGAVPGPACYGKGGTEPTVSDANLLLGYLNPDRVYGGSIRLNRSLAEAAFRPIAERFGWSLVEAAHGVIEVATANMLRALRLVSVQRGYDLREFALIAFGGAGPLHAGALAEQAGITKVIVPMHSGAFSALGCLVSPLRYDAVQSYRARIESWDTKGAEDRFLALEAQCLKPLLDEGYSRQRVTCLRGLDLRYVGQNYEIEVGYVPGGPVKLKAAFEERHRQLYGYATGEKIECVNIRVTASVAQDSLPLPMVPAGAAPFPTASHRAYFREIGEVDMPRFDRTTLPPGGVVVGPAMIEDDWSTTVVYPSQRCVADQFGNLVIETGERA